GRAIMLGHKFPHFLTVDHFGNRRGWWWRWRWRRYNWNRNGCNSGGRRRDWRWGYHRSHRRRFGDHGSRRRNLQTQRGPFLWSVPLHIPSRHADNQRQQDAANKKELTPARWIDNQGPCFLLDLSRRRLHR